MDRDTDDSSNYVYAPLSLEVRPFRLARLKPALTRHAPIECTLIDSDIDTGGVEYEAVSYTWGTEWDADIVTVDNQVLSISLNLSLVFRDLRLPTVDRVLWIDAVCIDQRNDAERSHQVQQMGDMFRNAKRVLFCVGRPTEMTDMLFTVLFGLQTLLRESFPKQGRPVTCHEVRKSGILDKLQKRHYGFWSRLKQGFDTILQQPWFFRVWIIQEVANARQGRLYCGPVSVPTNLFVEALILFRVEPPPHCEQILRMMPGRHKKFTRKPLALLLQELADSQATDARDKVWALLDLCSDAEARTALKPDYTKTETDLIRDMIAYLCNCG
ncbi:heterokaryon incompatibility protein-domain-containing protein, partial [Microdochium bolleyi]